MVKSVEIDDAGKVDLAIFLTVSGCPMKETLTKDSSNALLALDGVTSVEVELDVMSEEQRAELRSQLRGGAPEKEIPFARPNSLTAGVCRGVRQGRRRQVVGDRQPRRRDGRAGPAGGRRRRRRLRLLGAAHARGRAAPDAGRRHDPAAHQPRREGHLDRHVRARQPARRVAWPDAAPRAPAVPRRRLLGRPRRAAARPAARHRRHRDLRRAAHPDGRDPRRHDAAAGRRRGRRAGRLDRPADPPARRRRHREHVRGSSCPTAPVRRSSAPAAARRSPTR